MVLVTDTYAVFPDGMSQFTSCPVNGTTTLWSDVSFMAWCGGDPDNVCQNGRYGELFNIPKGNVSLIAGAAQQNSTTSANSTISTASTTSTSETTRAKGKVPVTVPLAVGVGIGVPLALLVCALGALYTLERKKRIAAEGNVQEGNVQVYYEKKPFAELQGAQDQPAELR
jgi:hypothetical protein